ncbi:hypothetical protein GW17_00015322 [Ensete ventricosum]|nr:hypothetical protein GW17_00015322 [Ensete ventricosum]
MHLPDCDPSPIQSPLHPSRLSLLYQNEGPIEQHDPALDSATVYVLDLCPRRSFVPSLYVLSPMSTPFIQLGHFTKFHPSCSTPQLALS